MENKGRNQKCAAGVKHLQCIKWINAKQKPNLVQLMCECVIFIKAKFSGQAAKYNSTLQRKQISVKVLKWHLKFSDLTL